MTADERFFSYGNIHEIKHKICKRALTGEEFTRYQSLTDFLGIECLSVMLEHIPPGNRTSPPHYHTSKNEIHIIIKGQITVFFGESTRTFDSGDFISFLPGGNTPHYMQNNGSEAVEMLTISFNSDGDSVIFDDNQPSSQHIFTHEPPHVAMS